MHVVKKANNWKENDPFFNPIRTGLFESYNTDTFFLLLAKQSRRASLACIDSLTSSHFSHPLH